MYYSILLTNFRRWSIQPWKIFVYFLMPFFEKFYKEFKNILFISCYVLIIETHSEMVVTSVW